MKAVINVTVVILGSAEQLFAGKTNCWQTGLSGSNEFVLFLELPLFVQSCLSYFQRENACAATPVALMAPVVVGTPAHAQTKRVTVRAARSSVAAQVSSMCRDIIRLFVAHVQKSTSQTLRLYIRRYVNVSEMRSWVFKFPLFSEI